MPRIEMLPQQPPDPDARELFDRVRRSRGSDAPMPDLYRVLGVAPAMFKAWLDFAWPLRLNAKTSRKLRELMILRGALISRTAYEWAHHLPMAEEAGISAAQIAALPAWREAGCFDATERVALQLADEVTSGPGASQETIDALKRVGFNDAQVIELVLTTSFYVCVGRFLHSMDIKPEADYETPLPSA
ncbi:carboxymuconolactone decarboxylase family protein [Variovorax sp. Sphag1AA]|uniref:carboxymuconolactone decarboxylase family protein n=1 Tax=Variovorax sp. Sphag1AA TaxID=2587027 RepID=UPI00160BC763|nr:carboxymuconolactone decarboxylase family protein [Variovorax sp. Sphag1AA]MBB3182034.1 alkylhydroperoxidase family enzyme [Variovorax sp. Sphag1AA]